MNEEILYNNIILGPRAFNHPLGLFRCIILIHYKDLYTNKYLSKYLISNEMKILHKNYFNTYKEMRIELSRKKHSSKES